MPGRAEQNELGVAITKLMSLHEGDAGVLQVIQCGTSAVPALHSILFTRESSGIFETRRRAIDALVSLKAFDVLREYLSAPHDLTDPVERSGEDAVINAAARALGRLVDSRDLPLFYGLLRIRPLAGVIEAVGRFRRTGTLPYLVQALGDDFTRPAAEDAIRRLGIKARKSLLNTAISPSIVGDRETGSSISRRRSALGLLRDLPLTANILPDDFLDLIETSDPWIALLASRITLSVACEANGNLAIVRLLSLLKDANELMAEEIEDCLVDHFAFAKQAIEEAAQSQIPDSQPIWRSHDYSARVFEHIRSRTSAGPSSKGTVI